MKVHRVDVAVGVFFTACAKARDSLRIPSRSMAVCRSDRGFDRQYRAGPWPGTHGAAGRPARRGFRQDMVVAADVGGT